MLSMKINIFQPRNRRVIIYVGISAAAIFAGIFLVLVNLATSMNSEEAKKRVRVCIQRDIAQSHMNMLKEKGYRLPDNEMARQWQEELTQAKNLNIISIKIKRPLLDILFAEITNLCCTSCFSL